MTVPQKIMNFRKQRARDIERFANLLEKYVGNGISTKLYEGANQLKNETYIPRHRKINGELTNTDANYWGYCINDIKIDITANKHLEPKYINKAEAFLSINLVSDFRNWENIKDPFCELSLKVTIKGLKPKSEEGVHYFGFHLDRHHESQSSEEIHPTYHLQYVLNPKNIENFNYGSSLNLDAPRFLHYPMDLILGITYLIANFQPNNYASLINDRESQNIIKKYQNSIWKPYSFAISQHWQNDGSSVELDKLAIFPYLI